MAKGDTFPSEKARSEELTLHDNFPVYQLTKSGDLNVHMYPHHVGWTSDSKWLVYTSNRTGENELFALKYEKGEILQLTEGKNVEPFGWGISSEGNSAYYRSRDEFWKINIPGLEDELLFTQTEFKGWKSGMISPTPDDKKIYFSGRKEITENEFITNIFEIDFEKQTQSALMPEENQEKYVYCHVILNPKHPELLHHARLMPKEIGGMPRQLLWLMNRDGTGLKPFFKQKRQGLRSWERVGHQAWLPDGESMLIMSRRDKIKIVSLHDEFRKEKPWVVKGPNFWHPNPSFQGDLVVSDTMWKDTGLWLVDIKTKGKFNLCLTRSDAVNPKSSPQSGHPHPSFSPDGKVVIFNRYQPELGAQIYSCELNQNPFT
ncbi:MAG: hypothetical protein ACFFCS_04565 [Candidatus Hodarchaeota archaeon]